MKKYSKNNFSLDKNNDKEYVCEFCERTPRYCKCKTTSADYIEALPNEKIKAIHDQIDKTSKEKQCQDFKKSDILGFLKQLFSQG